MTLNSLQEQAREFLDAAFEGRIAEPAADYDPAERPAEEQPPADADECLHLSTHEESGWMAPSGVVDVFEVCDDCGHSEFAYQDMVL